MRASATNQNTAFPSAAGFLQTVIFTCTVFVAAFLLFWVQPLFAKMILPILGGSSSVWTTSLLFFQVSLLAGYIYAHFSSKILAIGRQILLHLVLLAAAFFSLPFYADYGGADSPEGSPVFWVLSFAALTVGPSFFMVAATAPLLQRWFSLTRHHRRATPYFLYAASNLGSMAALFCFPVVLEPALGVRLQTVCWQSGYGLLVVLFLAAGFITVRGLDNKRDPAVIVPVSLPPQSRPISAGSRLAWLFLAFLPSSMMLGLTSYITTDLAPVSMFWVVPLALYLLSFVIVFSRWQHLLSNRSLAVTMLLSFAALVSLRVAGLDKSVSTIGLSIALNTALFFASAWLLHGYLSSTKPAAGHLTEFYLWMAAGGMLGGVFNALLAPVIFNQIYEYYVVIISGTAFALKVLMEKESSTTGFKTHQTVATAIQFGGLLVLFFVADLVLSRPITRTVQLAFAVGSLVLLAIAVAGAVYKNSTGKFPLRFTLCAVALAVLGNGLILTKTHANLLLERSFYGTLKIRLEEDRDGEPYHLFIHGSTRHNLQKFAADGSGSPDPLMYFHRHANLGHMIRAMKSHRLRPMQLGFVGLGAGAMSAYVEEGDTATYYEIDPKVVAMASNPEYFTYLSTARGAINIVVGDARLQLKKAADHSFDLLLIDAFASDAVPVHLLTTEAVAMYLRKLKDDGVLAFHLSNRYLALARVVQGMPLPSGYALYYASSYNVEGPAEAAERITGFFSHSQVAIIAKETALPKAITASARWRKLDHEPGFDNWTDDFSNILGVLEIW